MLRPTPNELLRNRGDSASLLTDSVEIWRATYAADGKGGQTTTLARISTGPGRFAPMGGELEYFADRIGSSTGWIVSIEPGRTVLPDDQLRINGRHFEVLSTDFGRTDSWLQRIPCREIT